MRKWIVFAVLSVVLPALAQQKSAKRGVCWDEKTQVVSEQTLAKMAPGVAWLYNWGVSPKGNSSLFALYSSFHFAPMCWNAAFDEAALRSWLSAHPETKYLLGFNEPNFSSQSNMTPQAAATAWPRLEQIAADYGLLLVAPALNFTAEKVGGRTWTPYEWLDEFFRLYPEAHIDLLAMHCYMNWYSSCTWLATEYFYSDLYNPQKKDAYGKYPHLVAALDTYREREGHFPRMMLTEFCAWENDGTITGVDFQIDQMTQKVQKLEQSDLVEGYAWFMANASAAQYPYMSLFETNSPASELSALGKVYTYMSAFDTSYYYAPGEVIQAKDYVDASTDNQQVRVRPIAGATSSVAGEEDSPLLQVELPASGWTIYQLALPSDGDYTLRLLMKSEADLRLFCDLDLSKKWTQAALPSTQGEWQQQTVELTAAKAGQHQLRLWNAGNTSLCLATLTIDQTTGISAMQNDKRETKNDKAYDLQGRRVGNSSSATHRSASPLGSSKNSKTKIIIVNHRLLFVK